MQKIISTFKTTLPKQVMESFKDHHIDYAKNKAYSEAICELVKQGLITVQVDIADEGQMSVVTAKVIQND